VWLLSSHWALPLLFINAAGNFVVTVAQQRKREEERERGTCLS